MERYRKNVYCDWEFLESLMSKLGDYPNLDNSFLGNNEVAICIKELLLSSDVKLYLNVSEAFYDSFLSEIDKKCQKGSELQLSAFEKLVYDINFKQQNNELHLHYNESKVHFNDSILEDKYLNSIFFSSESKEICNKAMEEYGIIVINIENMNDFTQHVYDQGVALQKKEENSWKICLDMQNLTPCNSLVVVDNYILNDTNSIDENLANLFDIFIPTQLNKSISFHLAIFTTLCNDRGIPFNSKMRLEKIYDILSKIRPGLNFSLSIIKCSKDKFHDRIIITNNLYISCGGGFDLFKKGKSQKTTTVSFFNPFFNFHTKWSRKAYSNILNDTATVFNNTSLFDESKMNDSFPCFVVGEKQNRLLSQST